MKPYHENIKQQARRMHQQGMPQKQIAKSLHVPYSTIWRWTNDAYAERQRQASRAQKHKYRGTCIDCGTSTSYSGKGTQGSARCDPCYRKHMSDNRKWNQQNIIAAIHRWTAEHGRRPTPTDWIHAGPYWPPAHPSTSHPTQSFPNGPTPSARRKLVEIGTEDPLITIEPVQEPVPNPAPAPDPDPTPEPEPVETPELVPA